MKLILTISSLCFFNFLFAQTKESLTLHFEFNKYELSSEASSLLDKFVDQIKNEPIVSINIDGFCDSKGSNAYNDALSLKRVDAVKQYLGNKKLDQSIIRTKGHGENGLLNKDLSEADGIENRRVDIIVMIKEKPVDAPIIQEPKTLTTILEDTATKKGMLITLKNLEFENNSDVLLSKSIPVLTELYNVLEKNPSITISIEGHICCVLPEEGKAPEEMPSFFVSLSRARKVWSYLTQRGIDPKRLSYKGFGNSRPIYTIPERTEEERIANRRVEIRILEK
jgi:outer membrane protein OmpA-like peptidoglycan-associated protein